MQERQEKSANATKTFVKREGGLSAKSSGLALKKELASNGSTVKKEVASNGLAVKRDVASNGPAVKRDVASNGPAVKKEVASNGHKKELPGKSSTNGVKTIVRKEPVKRELDSSSDKKKEASSSGVKTIVKKKVTTTKVTSVKTEEKKGKKVFTLPGQKHEPPEERDPLRIFYASLHQQIPESEMAQIWMMDHGLLEAAEAKKALERKQRRVQNERNGTPMKSAPTRDHSNKPGNKSSMPNGKSSKIIEQKGKRKRDYSSDDDDFINKPKRKLKL